MAALIIVYSEDLEMLTSYLVEVRGYQQSILGYYPSEGLSGDTHWPIKDELPSNTFYHPEQSAQECCREVYSWAKFQRYSIDKVMAFETTKWFVNSEQPNFDNDRPGIKWEDFPSRAGKPE
jgi:hypothetical protein